MADLDLTEEEKAIISDVEMEISPVSAVHWLDAPENFQLKTALETATNARTLIEPEQSRLRELLNEAKNDIERDAREYQIWYIEKYYSRAADIAEKRLEYFTTIKTDADIEREKEKIKSDIIHWFDYYAFGYDPRARTALSIIPFGLFPKQKELVRWLNERVFYKRDSGLIEKSRDEGATELMVRWGLYHWLGTNGFSMLLSTRKEDEVDSKKNQNTLFERARYQIRLLPAWQYPKGFDAQKSMLSSMKLVNPENNNTLLGEAPVENMGRGGRVTCAMLDEFAFWSFGGYPQFRSLSQTTDSILMPSSVAGRLNQYADLAFDGHTAKFVLDWRENPLKDRRWYNSLPFGYISPKMSKTTIAQEVDRNYDAAQPGKVWHIKEQYNFITMSEFMRPFKEFEHKFYDERGEFKIPADWRIIETSDYGQSQGHDWSYFLGAQPRAIYPYADTHFIFIGLNLEPTGLTTNQAVSQWNEYREMLGIKRGNEWLNKPNRQYISHEQDGKKIAAGEEAGLRTVLREKYGETWLAWKTNYAAGINKIEDWFEPIELDEPNPFRPELSGRCQLVFVAPDNEYQLAFNERLSQWFVTTSATERGFATLRKQISAYHYPQSELGKAVKAMRPAKEFDDIIDAFRSYALMWNEDADPLTKTEYVESKLSPENQIKNLSKQYGRDGFGVQMLARHQEQRQIENRLEEQRKAEEDRLRAAFSSGGRRVRILGRRK